MIALVLQPHLSICGKAFRCNLRLACPIYAVFKTQTCQIPRQQRDGAEQVFGPCPIETPNPIMMGT